MNKIEDFKVGDIVELDFGIPPDKAIEKLEVVVGIVSDDRIDTHQFGSGRGGVGIPLSYVKTNLGSVDDWHALSLCAGWTLAMADKTEQGEQRRKVAQRAMEFLHAKLGPEYHNKLMVERHTLPEKEENES